MQSFKQYVNFKHHLKRLKKEREMEKKNSSLPVLSPVVHGRHAQDNDKSLPVLDTVVHGRHAQNNIKEEITGWQYLRNKSGFSENDWSKDYYDTNDVTSLHERLKEHYHETLETHKYIDYLKKYTQTSNILNTALINHHKGKDKYFEDVHGPRRDGLNSILKSKEAPEDINTFSGLGLDPRKLMDDRRRFVSPAFLSSSINPSVAISFAKTFDHPSEHGDPEEAQRTQHILHIPVRKGSRQGAYIDSHSNFGTLDGIPTSGEKEFLHHAGQTFEVREDPLTFIRPAYWDSDKKVKTYIWTAQPRDY